ncbi:MAG: hypothetical protein AAB400_01530 [Patescibacteria group bacterium]
MTYELVDIARGIAQHFTNQPSTVLGTHALWDRDGMRLALVKLIIRYTNYCNRYDLEMLDIDLLDFIACNEDFNARYGMRAPRLYIGMIIGIAAHLNLFEYMPSYQQSSQDMRMGTDGNHENGDVPEELKRISIFDLLRIEPIHYADSLVAALPCMAHSHAFLSSLISRSFKYEVFRKLKGYDHLFGWSEYVHALAAKTLLLPGIKQTPRGICIDRDILLAHHAGK